MNITEDSLSLGVMQPYLFPYIGYFQLINSCDKFILYDDVQYIKGGWINKNRILINKEANLFSLPLKKGERSSLINQRFFTDDIEKEKIKLLKKIKLAYKKSPYFSTCYPFLKEIINNPEISLSMYITDTIIGLCDYLNINTPIFNASHLDYNRELSGQARIIEINKNQGSTNYINAIGGKGLYDQQTFHKNNIKLSFLSTHPIIYKQFNNEFVANLSIIDVMMFNSREVIQDYLSEFDLVD